MSSPEFDGPRNAEEEALYNKAFIVAYQTLRGDEVQPYVADTQIMPAQAGAPDGVLYADRLRVGRRRTTRRVMGGIACIALTAGTVVFSDEVREVAHDVGERVAKLVHEQQSEEGGA